MADSKESHYRLLGQVDGDTDASDISAEDAIARRHLASRWTQHKPAWKAVIVTAMLFLSLASNVLLALKVKTLPLASPITGITKYMGLNFDKASTMWWNTEFSSTNETDVDYLWDKTIPWESGIIAMDNHEAAAMGLPKSQPFPWDSKHKSIYIVNAHHILHCVRNVYTSIQEYRHNKTQSVSYPHILHCLDSIRADTMCFADDTPRYVPMNAVHGFRPGDGQARTCRNWDKVQEFVSKHDPCYHYIQPGNEEISNLERFKYCAKDSQYLPKIRNYFGYPDNWVPNYEDQ